jgi:hypothetical protein
MCNELVSGDTPTQLCLMKSRTRQIHIKNQNITLANTHFGASNVRPASGYI